MPYNNPQTTKALRSLINSGSDLMPNMYDIHIYFPDENGAADKGSYMTVRADGFKIPEVGSGTYEIQYHGLKIMRPKTEQQFDRKFTLNFRADAAFDLQRRFTAWLMMVVDPVTGGVSNAMQFLGKVRVETIVGTYFATTLAADLLGPEAGDDPLAKGAVKSGSDNPLAQWIFYDVWPYKVTQPEFKRDPGDPVSFTVDFAFADVDYPYFGGNSLVLQ